MTEQTLPTVSELVRRDYRIADVLRKWGINYCCGGNLPLAEMCRVQGVDALAVQDEMEAAVRGRSLPASVDFNNWPLPFLVDYIQNVHHAYARNTGAQLHQQLSSYVKGHLKKYPYLGGVEEAFDNLYALLLEHMQEEEERVFPYLRQLSSAYDNREAYGKLFVRTLGRPLDNVSGDHKRIAATLAELRRLTDGYRFGNDACTNHQVLYHKLREFDDDLVQHKHLENNVLLPRAENIEKELRSL